MARSPHFRHGLSAQRLQRGHGVTLEETLRGRTLSLERASEEHHPWKTTPAWSAQAGGWVATVETGFVNETCPMWRTTVQVQAEDDRDFGINPLTGKPFFSDSVFSQRQNTGEVSIDIPLYLSPAISLTWRALGLDGDGPVPDFFAQFGVPGAATALTPDELAAGALPEPPTIPAHYRLLRACDLWIQQPRLALTSDISLQPGPATGLSNVTQTLSVRTPGDVLRIFAGDLPETPQGFDPLAGTYEEPTWDQLLISTVFLVSPQNAPLGSEPDETWTPYVRHNEFWHLSWAQPPFRQLPGDPGTPFIPPLAGGAAQLVVNFLTASLNDTTEQALDLLLGHSLAGHFWTVTGGGHDAAVLTPTTPPGKVGLDKAARLAAEAATQAAQRRQAKLDPDFPYQAEPFPLSLLSA